MQPHERMDGTTDWQHINVPKTTEGSKCEITTGTGDIHITLDPSAS